MDNRSCWCCQALRSTLRVSLFAVFFFPAALCRVDPGRAQVGWGVQLWRSPTRPSLIAKHLVGEPAVSGGGVQVLLWMPAIRERPHCPRVVAS
jgi:hypothetical protein